ncbi:MAG: hypothetical protein R3344_15130 [Acidobacteriota bacterium]|nr:hypothetical protein [Acidobacteriota bacterium]
MKLSRVAKTVGFGLLAYVGMVALFETLLGVVQPETGDTIVITTTDADGVSSDRVLGRDFAGGKHYASANHWPRAWYNNALQNPRVQVTMDGTTADYIAVPVDAEEHERVAAEIGNGIVFRILVGFAPQRFLRLDPVESR